MFSGLGPLGIRKDQIERTFFIFFSVAVEKAMHTTFCLCLMLIILGTLTVQGEIPENNEKNPLEVFGRVLGECFSYHLCRLFIISLAA